MRRWIILGLLLWTGSPANAQVPGPPLPAKYRARVRYQIVAPRDIHVAHYDAMIEHLEALGFDFDPPLDKNPPTDREDRTKNQIAGLVPGANAFKIRQNRSVASVLLVPEDFKLPDQPDQQMHVRLELASGIPPLRQRELGDQVRVLLGLLGFREATGYDNHGYSKKPYTRLVGVIPAGNLELLLRDLRIQPTGWFAPVIPTADLPSPLRNANPIVITEVLPDPEPQSDVAQVPAREPAFLEKLSPDLWALVQQKEKENQVVRMQMILIGTPDPGDKNLRFVLQQAAPSLAIDGWLGPVITGSVAVGHAPILASLMEVSTLRLVKSVSVHVDPGIKIAADNVKALEVSGLAELHKKGSRGKGVRLAILDTDFRGWEKLVGDKKLPASTRFVDLTAERDPDILPLPEPGDKDQIGHGTQCALAALLAAPEAEVTLIRFEGADPYQLYEIAQYFRGGSLSESLRRRQDEILAHRVALRNRREELLRERRKILDDFTDERELERNFGFLGPVMGWIFSDRQLHYQHMAYQEKLETELEGRYDRFLKLAAKVEALQGTHLAVNPLNWQDGQAMGSASPLSRWFAAAGNRPSPRSSRVAPDVRPAFTTLWFQSAGNTRGQAWTGFFRDADGNGSLEFAGPETKVQPGRWSHEINFLGWQVHEGKRVDQLPYKARVRVTMQWREPHDPDYYTRPGEEDFYLSPLATLQMQVLRERDPSLKILPADAFEVVGRSSRLPQRLEHQPGHSIYEHAVEFSVEKEGKYAVRVERLLPTRWLLRDEPGSRPGLTYVQDLLPTGLRPRGVATLTALEKNWELRARVFVDVWDEATRPLGRVVLIDHHTDQGSVGLPADARGLITVGAADFDGKPWSTSAQGPPAFLDLASKPDLLACAGLQVVPEGNTAYGTSLATPFAAGWAACQMSSGLSRDRILALVQSQAGKAIRAPSKK